MKALLSLLAIAVGGFFGYNHAESVIASRPVVEEPDEIIATPPSGPVSPITEAPPPEESTPEPIPEPEPAPAIMEEPEAPTPQPDEPETSSLESLPAVDFSSQTARVSGQSPELESALAVALESGDWPAYLGYLRRSIAPIAKTLTPERIDGSRPPLTDPLFRHVLHQERFLASFPEETFSKHFAANHDFARWLLAPPDTVATVIHNIHEKDDRVFLVDFLADLFGESEAELLEYTHLAIACAFVHDKTDRPAEANLRFHWYVDKHKRGKLFRDPRKSHVADLALVGGTTTNRRKVDNASSFVGYLADTGDLTASATAAATVADGAQFFRKLANDFWATTAGDSTRQNKTLGLLNAEVLGNFRGGFESNDIFARRTACDVYSDLAGYYRKAGKTDRADQIKKRIDRARREMKD